MRVWGVFMKLVCRVQGHAWEGTHPEFPPGRTGLIHGWEVTYHGRRCANCGIEEGP